MKRSKPMRHRSAKMEALYAGSGGKEGRAAFVARILATRSVCEAGEAIGAHVEGSGRWSRCTYEATDVHELLMRSGTGSKTRAANLLDDTKVKAVCRACHDWINTHSHEAIALGLKVSKHGAAP